jgi:hypothetical protein
MAMAMGAKIISKRVIARVLCGGIAVAAGHMYWVRELYVMWATFAIVFVAAAIVVGAYLFCLEGLSRLGAWLLNRTHAIRMPSAAPSNESPALGPSKN